MKKTPEKYTPSEIARLKNMFPDDDALKLLRKAIYPDTSVDADINGYLSLINTIKTEDVVDERMIAMNTIATKKLVAMVESALSTLQILTQREDQTAEEIAENTKKNSTK